MLKMRTFVLAGLVGLGAAAAPAARAAEKSVAPAEVVKVVGYLTKVEVAADGKSAVATLMVKGKGKVAVFIDDELTLKKFKVKKIRTDDEIKCSYKEEGGKNHSVSFLRAAGC